MVFLVLSCDIYGPGEPVFNFLFLYWVLEMVLNGKFRCRPPAPLQSKGFGFQVLVRASLLYSRKINTAGC